MTHLRLGVARADITPSWSLPLAGFAHRAGDSRGVARPLYARVLFFEQDGSGARRRALLVSADLIWWGRHQAERLRHLLGERWGLRRSHVILHATHTHSGPQTSDRFVSSLGKVDPGYLQVLESAVLAAVEQAATKLEPVVVERGRGECGFGINRRRRVGASIEMAPNEAGPTDPEVNVVAFKANSGSTKAVLIHYACHPTTTADNLISSEFPGVATELLERQLDPGAVVAYLQGCCGDVRPALVLDGRFHRGGDPEVRRFGRALADEVMSVMSRTMRRLPSSPLVGGETRLSLPLQKPPRKEDLEAGSIRADAVGEWSRLLLAEPDRLESSVRLEMTLLRVADGLCLLALDGEVVVDYGLFIKRRFANDVLPIPYSNGMIGYVPTATQVAEGGYEAEESIFYFGLPAPFSRSADRQLRDGMVTLVEGGN